MSRLSKRPAKGDHKDEQVKQKVETQVHIKALLCQDTINSLGKAKTTKDA